MRIAEHNHDVRTRLLDDRAKRIDIALKGLVTLGEFLEGELLLDARTGVFQQRCEVETRVLHVLLAKIRPAVRRGVHSWSV